MTLPLADARDVELFVPGSPAPRSDADRMLSMLGALELGQSDSMFIVTIPGAPWSKSRPRFSRRGHAYSKPEDQDAEKRTAMYLRAQVRQPYTGNVGLACLFFRPNRQRIDADNLLKHVCDAANGVHTAKFFPGLHPRALCRACGGVYPCATIRILDRLGC